MNSTETEIWRNQEIWIYKEKEEKEKEKGENNKEWIPAIIESMEIIQNNNNHNNNQNNNNFNFIHKFKIKINDNNILFIEENPPQGDQTEYIGFKKRQSTMNPKTCTDMTLLLNLNEPEIIECLRRRFAEKLIYTSIGPILVAVNPFERLNHLYEPLINEYFGKSIETARQLGPHIYQLSEVAYQKMFIDKYDSEKRENQSILVNGESGAGKTESTKQVLRYLTNVSTIVAKSLRDNGVDIPDDDFEKMIIAANPITESFGNAKTSRNNNSSRFGKFIELNYSADGYIEGASITTYLLETVRLVRQMNGERNYHIFYEAFRGLPNEWKKEWSFNSLNDFLYTNQSGEFNRHDGETDEDNFQSLTNALTQCGLNEIKKREVFGVVVGILHLGNITFVPNTNNGVDISESCNFHVKKVEELLGINREHLIPAVTKKSMVVSQNVIMKELNEIDSIAARDSFSKILYDYLFKWLIRQVNTSLKCSIETRSSFIGVLDIFGFEYFTTNSFEQLCINYANEKLQDHFNYATFKSEQDVYIQEGLKWTFVQYPDNSQRLELFENKTVGLFALCDENLKIPSPSDDKLSTSFYKNHLVENSYLIANQVSQRKKEFTIKHFACDVTYSINGFLDKNRSEISSLINDCMNESEVDLVSDLLGSIEEITPISQRRMSRGTSLMGRSKQSSSLSPSSQNIRPGVTIAKRTPTVASQFSSQLKELITKIKTTTSHFIRCIKPNSLLEKVKFDKKMVMDQIRCGGALGAVQVLRAGFPNRMEFNYFVNRYSALMWVCGKNLITDDVLKFDYQMNKWSSCLRNPVLDAKIRSFLLIRSIPLTISVLNRLEGVIINDKDKNNDNNNIEDKDKNEQNILIEGLQMGHSRIFLRANAFEYLERLHLRTKICSANYLKKRWKARKASRSQSMNKSRRRASQTVIESMMYFTEYTRSRILREVWAHILLQRRGRVFLEQRRLKKAIEAAILLESRIRMFIAYRLVSRLRWNRRNNACIRIQTISRRWLCEKRYKLQICSILKIQLFVRSGVAKRKVYLMRKEKADKEQQERESKATFIINMFCRRGIVKYRIEKRRLKSIEEKNRVDLQFAGQTIIELQKKVEELKCEVHDKDEKIIELSKIGTNVSEYMNKIELLERELRMRNEENEELRSNLFSKDERMVKFEFDVKSRDESIEMLRNEELVNKGKIDSLEKELMIQNEKIMNLENELQQNQIIISSSQSLELQLQSHSSQLNDDKDDDKDDIKDVNSNNNNNQNQNQDISEYEERIKLLEIELKEKNDKIIELESSSINTIALKSGDNESKSDNNNNNDNQNKDISEYEERLKLLEIELKEKNDKIIELSNEIEIMKLNEINLKVSEDSVLTGNDNTHDNTDLVVKTDAIRQIAKLEKQLSNKSIPTTPILETIDIDATQLEPIVIPSYHSDSTLDFNDISDMVQDLRRNVISHYREMLDVHDQANHNLLSFQNLTLNTLNDRETVYVRQELNSFERFRRRLIEMSERVLIFRNSTFSYR